MIWEWIYDIFIYVIGESESGIQIIDSVYLLKNTNKTCGSTYFLNYRMETWFPHTVENQVFISRTHHFTLLKFYNFILLVKTLIY